VPTAECDQQGYYSACEQCQSRWLWNHGAEGVGAEGVERVGTPRCGVRTAQSAVPTILLRFVNYAPCRNRTCNPLIKSQLLCQLS
jgi:hypothetical protein